jgi:NAD(P)-dependent dehydrogenase (short-subunit alcohol dehydrogenase family)
MADPENPVVIVTGGARGLGRAMTLALLRSGARVAVADLPVSAPEVRELKEIVAREGVQDRLLSIECDVTQWQSCSDTVDRVIAHFGAVHGLVNNAAIGMQNIGAVMTGKRKRFHEVDAEVWKKSIDANVNGPFQMAKAVAPHLVAQGYGRIVNITTSHYTMVAESFSPYGPTKAAMEAATVVWSKDLAGTGVTVNALLPGGAANTRMSPPGEVADRSTLVQPEVMMAPIVWLMSPRSNGVTGRRIIAKDWDAARLASTPADKIGSPAGW